MHGHTTELVTNLLLPAMYDVSSVARSKLGKNLHDSIDIIDGDDYDRIELCVDRLESAMQHPSLDQLVLSEIEIDRHVIQALMKLLRSKQKWEAIYMEFCEGDVAGALQAILSLTNVTKLEIAGSLTCDCLRILSNVLTQNNSLRDISLLGNFDAQRAELLVAGLTHSGVQSLKLAKCSLDTGSIIPLVHFFRTDSKLWRVMIDRCNIEEDSLAALVDSLCCHIGLKELFIGANLQNPALQKSLTKILQRNRIQKLSLRFALQASRDDELPVEWLVSSLASNTSLKTLDLSETALNDAGLIQIASALCGNSTLEELRLHENRIMNPGAKVFGHHLPHMRGVKRVFLHRNRFDEVGAEAIRNGVNENDNILEMTIPTMGQNMKMSRYQRLISYETCLNSGGKRALKFRSFPSSLWPLMMNRAGNYLWTPYCEFQMQSVDKWKRMQQADVIFHFLRGSGIGGCYT